MSRDSAQWGQPPKLPGTHYVDTSIYTDEGIFREEIEKIFNKVWLIACHESEIPKAFDYRTYSHPCGKSLIIMRGEDMRVRCFYNTCSHRGSKILWKPAGNARRLTCIFHHWQYDATGACVDIPREKDGYGERLCKAELGLRQVRCEVAYGGFAWVNIDDHGESLADFIGDAFSDLQSELSVPIEIFSYSQAVFKTNYKLWHDTNRELYHDYMHYHNRVTGLGQKGYFDRRYHNYPNGHVQLDSMEIQYANYDNNNEQRKLAWPGSDVACHKLINIFPGTTVVLRAPAFRVDTMTPLSPTEILIEFRGFGVKGEKPEERELRVRDHNSLWTPFGVNQHEDMLATEGQIEAVRRGTESQYLLHAREEKHTTHDEIGLRSYYAEWSRRMGRSPSDPFGDRTAAESRGGRVANLAKRTGHAN